jgi:DNA-binding CsgD family transcriptional regulator
MGTKLSKTLDVTALATGLYADVLDGLPLRDSLSAISAALGGTMMYAHRFGIDGPLRTNGLISMWNIPEDVDYDYQKYWVEKDVFLLSGWNLNKNIINFSDLVSPDQLFRTDFWNDYLRRRVPCVHGLTLKFDYNSHVMGSLTTWRGPQAEPFSRDAEVLLAQLGPHIIRAFMAEHRLGAAALQGQTLNAMAEGIAIIAASGRLVFANAALQRMAAARDGLSLGPDGLLAAARSTQTALNRAVGVALLAAAGRGELRPDEGSLTLPRPSGAAPWLLDILPLPAGRRGALAGQAGCAIMITDPDAPRTPSEHLLVELFGLTPAEASLAASLLGGATIAEHAKRRRIGIATARTHLSRILEKTGTRRQGDLIARLAMAFR